MVNPKIKRGSVVFVDFPFSDGYKSKVRPVVIITPDNLLPLMKDSLLALLPICLLFYGNSVACCAIVHFFIKIK